MLSRHSLGYPNWWHHGVTWVITVAQVGRVGNISLINMIHFNLRFVLSYRHIPLIVATFFEGHYCNIRFVGIYVYACSISLLCFQSPFK